MSIIVQYVEIHCSNNICLFVAMYFYFLHLSSLLYFLLQLQWIVASACSMYSSAIWFAINQENSCFLKSVLSWSEDLMNLSELGTSAPSWQFFTAHLQYLSAQMLHFNIPFLLGSPRFSSSVWGRSSFPSTFVILRLSVVPYWLSVVPWHNRKQLSSGFSSMPNTSLHHYKWSTIWIYQYPSKDNLQVLFHINFFNKTVLFLQIIPQYLKQVI